MAIRWRRHVVRFAAFQVGDAIACAIPLGYIKRDLENLNVPHPIQRALPTIKAASAAGLLLGLRWPRLGRLTAVSLMAYFVAAIGFHIRAKDAAWRKAPAASLLATSAVVGLRAFRPRPA